MSALVIERYTPTGWTVVGELPAGGPTGSMSHNPQGDEGGAREIVLFTCNADHSLIERSVLGADQLDKTGAMRQVTTLGTDTIARLGPGQEIELMLRTDNSRMPSRIRFRHENAR